MWDWKIALYWQLMTCVSVLVDMPPLSVVLICDVLVEEMKKWKKRKRNFLANSKKNKCIIYLKKDEDNKLEKYIEFWKIHPQMVENKYW